MSKRLEEFLVDLASDTALRRRVAADPEREYGKAGLTELEQAALRSGDSEVVRTALGRPHSDHLTQFGIAPRVEVLLKKAQEYDVKLQDALTKVKVFERAAKAAGGGKKGPKRRAKAGRKR